jgi:O-antigen ligase
MTADHPYGSGGPNEIGADTIWKLSVFVVVCLSAFLGRRSRLFWFAVTPFAPFLAWLSVSVFVNGWSLAVSRSIASLLLPIVYLGACAQVLTGRRDMMQIRIACLISIVLSVCIGFTRRLLGETLFTVDSTTFWRSHFGQNNELTLYSLLAVALSISIALAIVSSSWWKNCVVVSLLGMSFVMGVRIAIAATLICALATAVTMGVRSIARVGVLLVIGAGIGWMLSGQSLLDKSFHGKEATVSTLETSGRSTAWPLYWRFAMEEPVIGHGPSADIAFARREGLTAFPVSHNEYLGLIIYTGIPGMLLYVGAFVALARRVGGSTRGRRTDKLLAAAAFGALVFLAVTAITDNPIRNQNTMFPLMAAIGCCVSGSRVGANSTPKLISPSFTPRIWRKRIA